MNGNLGFWVGLLFAGFAALLLKAAADDGAPCPVCGSHTEPGSASCPNCHVGLAWGRVSL